MSDSALLPIDADTIRATYNSVLWGAGLPTGEALDTLREQLEGHVQLLSPEVQALAARMRGETRKTAVHVLVGAAHLMEEYADVPRTVRPVDAHDLAVLARGLLTLYLHHGPLGEPAGADAIAEEIRRRLRSVSWEPSADDEPFEQWAFPVTPATESTTTHTLDGPSTGRSCSCPSHHRSCTHSGRSEDVP